MAEAHMTRLLYLPLAQGGELATRVSLDLATQERAATLKGFRLQSYLAGRALLALALKLWYGQPSLPALQLGEHGRPAFVDPSLPDFSLSHSGEALLLLLGKGPLGGDIEQHRPRRNLPKLMEAVLGEAERQWLAAQDEVSQLASFYQLWTLREAIVKTSGRGIAGFSRLAINPFHTEVQTCEVTGGTLLGGALIHDSLSNDSLADGSLSGYSLALCLPESNALWPESLCCDGQGRLTPFTVTAPVRYRLIENI